MSKKTYRLTTTIEGISEYIFDNGLTLLLFPDQSQDTVTVNITYLVGSRHEGLGEAGMAHLLEHMLFKHTPMFPEIKGILHDHGAHYNGTTWFDRTNYFETLTATEKNLRFALKLEADRMVNCSIRQEDLDSEMTVVRNEFEMGENNPVHVLHDQMMSAAYRWHNYGKTTIGNRSDIERVPVQKLREFYQHFYQPDNAVLLVAGKLDVEQTLSLVEEYFSVIPKPSRILRSTYTEEPAQDGPRTVTLLRNGDVASCALAYHIPSGAHEDHAALRIAHACLTDEPSGVLYKSLVESGKAAELHGISYRLAEPGIMFFFTKPANNDDAQSLLQTMQEEIEQNVVKHITEADVKRAKARLLKDIKLGQSDSKYISVKMSEYISVGSWKLFFWYRDRLKEVTFEKVKDVLSRYCLESNRTSGLFVPVKDAQRAEIPHAQNPSKMLADYESKEVMVEGTPFVASPENIDNSTQYVWMPAAVKASFLPKQTRGDTVLSQFVLRFGNKEELTKHRLELSLIPSLLMRGTKTKSFIELQDRLNEIESSLSFGGAKGTCVAHIQTDKANTLNSIELLREIITSPRFDEKEFDIVKLKDLKSEEESLSDPQYLAFTQLARMKNPWPKDSIFYAHTIEEKIELLKNTTYASTCATYEKFYGSDNLHLSMVGSFDTKDVQKAVEEGFCDWSGKTQFEQIIPPYIDNEAGEIIIRTPDKQMALVAMAVNLPMQDTHEDFAAITLANYIFGETMKSRLATRLREREGISYGASSRFKASKLNACADLSMYAICAPQNALQAKNSMLDEYHLWLNKGVSDVELNESKISLRLSYENCFADDPFLVNALANNIEIERKFSFYADLIKRIENTSSTDIKNALAKAFGSRKLSIVLAGDLQ